MDTEFFLNASFDDLAALVDQKAEETPTLEFKRKAVPEEVELQKGDKKLLGEVISGFANATGGILVLGISTKNVDGVDQAAFLMKMVEVQAIASRYRAYAGECVAPPVGGVVVRAVEDGSGSGLIVVVVPQGPARPHMSRPHHSYFRRVLDRFVPMEAYEVEEMMRLKTAPELGFISDVRPAGSVGNVLRFHIYFGLENVGKVTAKFPYIQYLHATNQPRQADYGLTGNGSDLWQRVSVAAAKDAIFAASADQVLHPGQALHVSKLELGSRYDERFASLWTLDQISAEEPLRLRFAYGCEDHPKKLAEIVLTKAQILSATNPS